MKKTACLAAMLLSLGVKAQSIPPGQSNILHVTQFCQNNGTDWVPVYRWTNSYPYFSGQGWCYSVSGLVCSGPIGYLAFEVLNGDSEASAKLVESNYTWTAIGTGTFCYTNPPPVLGPEIDELFEIKAPTNHDASAVLVYSYILTTNHWHITPNYNGQYYGSSFPLGEYTGPTWWRSSNSVYDPAWRRRWSQSGHYIKTNQSPNW